MLLWQLFLLKCLRCCLTSHGPQQSMEACTSTLAMLFWPTSSCSSCFTFLRWASPVLRRAATSSCLAAASLSKACSKPQEAMKSKCQIPKKKEKRGKINQNTKHKKLVTEACNAISQGSHVESRPLPRYGGDIAQCIQHRASFG